MLKITRETGIMLLLITISLIVAPALGENGSKYHSTHEKLILNIYLDKTGKALVTGYVPDISSLGFLKQSQYHYENNTSRLDVMTDVLTHKDGDLWTLKFTSSSIFDYYHLTFYLPRDTQLKNINSTQGLQYFLSTSNDSLIADFQGYGILGPQVAIQYQQPATLPQPAGTKSVQSTPVSGYQQPPFPPGPAGAGLAQNPSYYSSGV